MKHKSILLVSIFCVVFALLASKPRPVHIYMAGDSTMANKVSQKSIKDTITGEESFFDFPEKGWGQLLPRFFNDNVVVDNRAQNGRSTRTFIEDGRWDKIIDEVQQGDFVVIQFAHNDSSSLKKSYTPPNDYKKNLIRFVDDVKQKGATPILCTSVVRRRFDHEGRFLDSHGVYLDITREVAREKNIPMIDMYEKSKKLIVAMGNEQSKSLFMNFEPKENELYPKGLTDNTHFVEKGALEMANLFVAGIKEQKIKSLTKNLAKKK